MNSNPVKCIMKWTKYNWCWSIPVRYRWFWAVDQLFVLYFNIQYKCLKLYTPICSRETLTMAYLVTPLSPCIYFTWEKEQTFFTTEAAVTRNLIGRKIISNVKGSGHVTHFPREWTGFNETHFKRHTPMQVTNAITRQSIANMKWRQCQMAGVRTYTCSERHPTLTWCRQKAAEASWETLDEKSWEMDFSDHCHMGVY